MGHATLEWIYVGVVIAILTWVGVEAWTGEKILEEVPEDAETIKVIGQQWLWTFEHEDGSVEVGKLTLKVGKTYKFEVTSKDVIHAFNIPSHAILIDAVPGRVNHIWMETTTPGEYLIQCREYCGLLHYNMRAMLIIEE
ncbi:MAG: hypothetical protein QW416_05840 [Candidatus Nitrosocaldaceae archaeon]